MEGQWFTKAEDKSKRHGAYTPRNRRSAASRQSKQPDDPDQMTVENIYIQFIENTQIPWIYYISTRQKIWKVIWLIIIVGGIAVALIQSRNALEGYTGYDVSLQTTFNLNSTLPFPAVTICTNSPINWRLEEALNSSIYQEVHSRRNDDSERKKYDSKFKRKGKLYEEYVLFDVLRKYPLPIPTYGAVQSVYWEGKRYFANGTSGNSFKDLRERNIIKLMHDLYYGDCLTFNAGVDNDEQFQSSALNGIQFEVDWDAKERYPELNDPAIALVVHPVGVAPTFGDGNNFKVYPKDEVTVGVKEKEIQRLSSPYPSHCVPNERYPLRANSVYYSDERKFLYSIDACINTCIQRLSLDICSCWDYQIPVGLAENETKFQSSSICASRCSRIDSALNVERCKCHLPCREIVLDLSYSVISNLVTEIIKSDFGALDKNESIPTVPPQTQKTTIRVFLKTSMYEFSNEVPKYTVADFLGIVGGNAAFWIGISAVSLFEIVELVYHLSKYKFRRWYNKNVLKKPVSAIGSSNKLKINSTTIIRIPRSITRPQWRSSMFTYIFHPRIIVLPYKDHVG